MPKFKRRLRQACIFLGVFIVALELTSWLYIRFVNQNIALPTYSLVNAGSKFWVAIDPNFGVWHRPGSRYLHNKSCFTVEYVANSLGMRDKERTLQSNASRVAVLGDSFIEGWGNKSEDRLTDRLEATIGREVLNFGTSGGFGPIQEWQQYKHFVSRFSHDVVLLGILPFNDFTDSSYDYAVKTQAQGYRPYLQGSYPNYKLVRQGQLSAADASPPILKSVDFTLREWSAIYRVLRYLGSYRLRNFKLVPRWVTEFQTDTGRPPSMYYDYSQKDWDILRYCLEQMAQEARGKQFIVFTIPQPTDFARYDGSTTPPLTAALTNLAKQANFTYVDLLDPMAKHDATTDDLFFVCDNHWDAHGNEVATSILLPYVEAALAEAEQNGTTPQR
ncbi:MAG: SGNH/GDSL hydrolase family protein [Desulfovibrio sp.]|jgi:hypothetical protein|nr:SGNH/GDSL hydrolase family protein [Desulfovibrio sp.]